MTKTIGDEEVVANSIYALENSGIGLN